MERSSRSDSLPIAAAAAAVGGLIVFLGVPAGWFRVTVANVGGDFRGTADWTGLVAAIAGLVALVGGGAAILLRPNRMGTWGAGLASIGGIFAAAMAVIALLRMDSIAADIAAASGASGSAMVGLWVSLIGGLVAMLGGYQATKTTSSA